jgi:hypothetical protein
VLLGASLVLLLATETPPIRRLFHFAPVPAAELGLAALAGLLVLLIFELAKPLLSALSGPSPGRSAA